MKGETRVRLVELPPQPLPCELADWLAFDPDTDPEQAKQVFRERYGYEAQTAVPAGSLLLVGPVGEIAAGPAPRARRW